MTRRLYAAPLILFLLLVVGLPLGSTIAGSFSGDTMFAQYADIFGSKFQMRSFTTTLRLSLLTTVIGLVFAVLTGIALRHRIPALSRTAIVLGNMGANFSGVPSVLAFMILLGANGILTRLLVQSGLIGGFDVYSFSGLVITYSFFQASLATVLVVPVMMALPRDIEEASRLMGIGPARFWLRIGLPSLSRQMAAVATLLFANAMGTYATAVTLMGTNARIVTVRIGELVAGDVFSDPALANALSVCLLVVMLVPIIAGQALLDRGAQMMRLGSTLFLLLAAVLFAVPFLAIALGTFGAQWGAGLLPVRYSPDVLLGVIGDPRFHDAMGRSLAVSFAALALSVLLFIPAIIAGHCYWPALDRWLARLVVLPYAVPGVVLVSGYLQVFSHPAISLNGTAWILILAYVPLCFPMFYVTVKAGLNGLPIADWLDAGRLIGMRDERILLRVVLPMIGGQISLGAVLSLGILLGEFVYANMLVGGRFETLQIYMFSQRNESGAVTAAIILLYFLTITLITAASVVLSRKRSAR